jgi:hypothetical protein
MPSQLSVVTSKVPLLEELRDTSNSKAVSEVNTSTSQLTWNSTRFYDAAALGKGLSSPHLMALESNTVQLVMESNFEVPESLSLRRSAYSY